MSHEIPLSRPDITEQEIDAVAAVLRSGRLSIGPQLEEFERRVARFTGNDYAVGVNSGTSGLQLCMNSLGVGPGDEVVTSPFSFVASANPILMAGATPVFADICPRTLNMDPRALERAITPRTKAVVVVETFGNTAYMDQYAQIAARHEVAVVEDCCEALGCTLNGRPAGSFGRIGVFGFYPNKQITTGEGGMIVTSDKRLADLCRSLRSQGRPVGGTASPGTGNWLSHERLGYNFRMSEVNAALGVVQMERLPGIVQARQRVAEAYVRRLMHVDDIILPTIDDGCTSSWFVFVVRLAPSYTRESRDRIIAGLRRHEVGAADYFPCIHLQPFYREKFGFAPGDFPIAESVSARTIALPFCNDLTERHIDVVARTLELMIKRENLSRS
ncbi:MAG: DegT/DnrJ/EryC1/StrS family aminotransferase [Phycisphaerales bacterium]|nr:DegT/DnrJ/EryC1/StrS family aminotransferase [Phycisphaerales bacterium]